MKLSFNGEINRDVNSMRVEAQEVLEKRVLSIVWLFNLKGWGDCGE